MIPTEPTLKDALELLMKLGFPAVGVFEVEEDTIGALMVAVDETTLRRALSTPEWWDLWRQK